jgi:hypothetical protein
MEFALSYGLLKNLGGRWQIAPGRFDSMHIIRSLFYPDNAKEWLSKIRG